MPRAFTPCTGAVAVERVGCTNNDFLMITIDGFSFTQHYVVTGVSMELSGNYQFLHTVNDFVYFYAFGDRVGTLTITGVGFLKTCDGAKSGAKIFQIYNYYNRKKTAVRGGKALNIILTPPSGSPVELYGFLTGVKIDATQNDLGPIGYWTMRFEILPKKAAAGT